MGYVITAILSAAVTVGTLAGVYFYTPWQSLVELGETKLGATIQTIASTDKLSDFPSSYNTTINNLNNAKLEAGSTTSSLGIGVLTVGLFNATSTTATSSTQNLGVVGSLSVSDDGTASSTIRGNATSTLNGISLSSGCFQDITGTGCLGSFDNTASYNFTGDNVHNPTNASTTFVGGVTITGDATTTAATTTALNVEGSLRLNDVSYQAPSTITASSTFLTSNGVGDLIWDYPDWRLLADVTATSSVAGLEAVWAGTSTILHVYLFSTGNSGGGSNERFIQFNNDSGTNYASKIILNGEDAAGQRTQTSATAIELGETAGNSNPEAHFLRITNDRDSVKKFHATNLINGGTAGTAPIVEEVWGAWHNTTDLITRVNIYPFTTETWNSGTRLIVFGSRF